MLSVLHMKCGGSDPQPPNLGGTSTRTRARKFDCSDPQPPNLGGLYTPEPPQLFGILGNIMYLCIQHTIT